MNDMDITAKRLDPTQEPDANANRMAWMGWENLWRQAARKKDEHLLAKLIGTAVDTPKKQEAAGLVFEEWATTPRLFDGKLMRLLMRNGATIADGLVAPLCACGDKAIELMQKNQVNLSHTNYVGENGLSLVCMIPDDIKFERAWRMLRQAGLDPNATDNSLETAMDAAERMGRMELVERIESMLVAEQNAVTLNSTTPKTRKAARKTRL